MYCVSGKDSLAEWPGVSVLRSCNHGNKAQRWTLCMRVVSQAISRYGRNHVSQNAPVITAMVFAYCADAACEEGCKRTSTRSRLRIEAENGMENDNEDPQGNGSRTGAVA